VSERSAAPAAAGWDELEELARRDPAGRPYLERLLALWAEESGARGAALYVERDGALRRELVAGEGPFPARLEGGALPGGSVHRVDGGAVAALGSAGPQGAPPPQPATLLLASALRALALGERLKRQLFQESYRVVELESLYEVGLAIAATLDLDQLSEEILMRAVSLLDARRGALYRREGDDFRLDRTFGGDAREAMPVDDPALAGLFAARAEAGAGEGGSAGAAAGPEGLLPGARHLLAVPVGLGGRPKGLLVVGDKESRRGVGPFGASDRRTLSMFANQAAIALENARLHRQALETERLERELELAAEIQRQLLPEGAPEVPGFDLIGWNRPARTVGGDYYDMLPREDGRIALTVADVTGKGIGAALLVSTLHSALRLSLGPAGDGPALAGRLNRHIHDSSASNKFITLLTAELDPASGGLAYVNAGHNPGLILRAGGGREVVELSPGGLPLGLLPGGSYRGGAAELAPGDLLCLYTDGITECASPADEEFGVGRLVDCLVELREAPLEQLVERIDRRTREFADGLPQLDDQTLILLRRRAA